MGDTKHKSEKRAYREATIGFLLFLSLFFVLGYLGLNHLFNRFKHRSYSHEDAPIAFEIPPEELPLVRNPDYVMPRDRAAQTSERASSKLADLASSNTSNRKSPNRPITSIDDPANLASPSFDPNFSNRTKSNDEIPAAALNENKVVATNFEQPIESASMKPLPANPNPANPKQDFETIPKRLNQDNNSFSPPNPTKKHDIPTVDYPERADGANTSDQSAAGAFEPGPDLSATKITHFTSDNQIEKRTQGTTPGTTLTLGGDSHNQPRQDQSDDRETSESPALSSKPWDSAMRSPTAENPNIRTQPNNVDVNDGDTLWDLCVARYGDGRFFRAIFEINRVALEGEKSLKAGMCIRMPALADVQRSYSQLLPEELQANSQEFVGWYSVQNDETLFEIARNQLGQASRYLEILELNLSSLPVGTTPDSILPLGLRLQMPD